MIPIWACWVLCLVEPGIDTGVQDGGRRTTSPPTAANPSHGCHQERQHEQCHALGAAERRIGAVEPHIIR